MTNPKRPFPNGAIAALVLIPTVIIAGILGTVTGCSVQEQQRSGLNPSDLPGSTSFLTDVVELPDGRKVTCVAYAYGGGVSCDWSGIQ